MNDVMRRWAEARRRNRDLFFIPDPDSDVTTAADLASDYEWEEKFEDLEREDWNLIESPDTPSFENREVSFNEYKDLILGDPPEKSERDGRISFMTGHVRHGWQSKVSRLRMEYRRYSSQGWKAVKREDELVWVDDEGEVMKRYFLWH